MDTTLLFKVKLHGAHNTFIESKILSKHTTSLLKVKLYGVHNIFIESKTLWSTLHFY